MVIGCLLHQMNAHDFKTIAKLGCSTSFVNVQSQSVAIAFSIVQYDSAKYTLCQRGCTSRSPYIGQRILGEDSQQSPRRVPGLSQQSTNQHGLTQPGP